MSVYPDPHISFWRLECDDYPIVDNKILSRKELRNGDKKYRIDKIIKPRKG